MQRLLLALVVIAFGTSPALAQVVIQQMPVDAEPEAPTPQRDHGPRARYGLSLGVLGGGGDSLRVARAGSNENVAPAVGGELQGRIGVQLEDHFAIFYQGSFAAGHEVTVCVHWASSTASSSEPCPASDDAIYLHASSLVLEATFARGMQIGIGGSVVAVLFDTPMPSTEIHYGWLARVGYAFGGDGPGTRRGFTIGLQANVSIAPRDAPGPLVDLAFSLGWESF